MHIFFYRCFGKRLLESELPLASCQLREQLGHRTESTLRPMRKSHIRWPSAECLP